MGIMALKHQRIASCFLIKNITNYPSKLAVPKFFLIKIGKTLFPYSKICML